MMLGSISSSIQELHQSETVVKVRSSLEGLLKYTVMFTCLGVIFVIVSATILGLNSSYYNFYTVGYLNASFVLLIIGIVNLITAAIGFVLNYNLKKNLNTGHLLHIFTVFLIILQQFLLSGSLASLFLNGSVNKVIHNNMQNSMVYYFSSAESKQMWDSMQRNLNCCGIHGPKDWVELSLPTPSVPQSCEDYTAGCLSKVVPGVEFNVSVAGYCLCALLLLEFLLVIISCRPGSFLNKLRHDAHKEDLEEFANVQDVNVITEEIA